MASIHEYVESVRFVPEYAVEVPTCKLGEVLLYLMRMAEILDEWDKTAHTANMLGVISYVMDVYEDRVKPLEDYVA